MHKAEFFARMTPEFARQEIAARENAVRQAHVKQLLGKAEYEFDQMYRELSPLMVGVRSLDDVLAEADANPVDAQMAADPATVQ
jgi:hypothetical protein